MAVQLDRRLIPYVQEFIGAASAELGATVAVISGYRTAEHNAAVGGASRSLHLRGLAFDLRIAGLPRDQVPGWVWTALGEAWESIGGRWGGRFSPPDVNHFDVGLGA